MNMKLPSFNVKDMMREAGSTISTQVSRVVQVLRKEKSIFMPISILLNF